MQALISAYPGGRSGVALLLLRATLGFALLLQGATCLGEPGMAPAIRACTEIACGALLTVGFLTPVAAILLALSTSAFRLLWAQVCASSLFGSASAMVFAGAILAAVFLLGPGAFSIDAKMFGRREIIIPPSHPRH